VIAAEIADPDYALRLALRDGAIVGYCKMGDVDMDVDATDALELHRLYVDTSTKGAGVAKTLMDDGLAWARGKARASCISASGKTTRARRHSTNATASSMCREHKFMVGRVADRQDFIWRLEL
jgi:predicted N-acetyltransferase YhbS